MCEQPSLRSWRNSRASDFWWRSHESSPILSRLCHSRSWPRRQNKSAKSRKLRRLAKPVFGSSCVNLKGRNGVPSVCNTFNNVRVIRKQGVRHPPFMDRLSPSKRNIQVINRFPSIRTLFFIYFLLSGSSSSYWTFTKQSTTLKLR